MVEAGDYSNAKMVDETANDVSVDRLEFYHGEELVEKAGRNGVVVGK